MDEIEILAIPPPALRAVDREPVFVDRARDKADTPCGAACWEVEDSNV